MSCLTQTDTGEAQLFHIREFSPPTVPTQRASFHLFHDKEIQEMIPGLVLAERVQNHAQDI